MKSHWPMPDKLSLDKHTRLAFVIGTGRCGTTMLAQILNAHSRICVPHELQLIFGYSGNGPRLYEYFATAEAQTWQAPDFIKVVSNLCPHRFEKFFDYQEFFNAREYPEKDLSLLLSDLYSATAKSKGKDFFLEQTPWYGQRLDLMNELFPEAKFIHIIRDGRDVALSFARTPWWHDSSTDNLERWGNEVSKIADDAKKILETHRYLEIKYEEFVLAPEVHTSRVLNFLGFSFEDGMLLPEKLIDYSVYRKMKMDSHMSSEFNKWNKQKKKAVFADNVFGWKRSNPEMFNDMSDQTRAALRRFGYEA